jgi:ABC-type glutathione transport system ATPase component
MSGLLEVLSLTVELPTPAGWVRPVNEVSVRISKGESLGLVGDSGSGKTMLSLALMGLLPPGARVSGEASLATQTSTKKLPVVAQAATHIAVMRAGQFLEVGAAEQVLHQPKTAAPANCFPPSPNCPARKLFRSVLL